MRSYRSILIAILAILAATYWITLFVLTHVPMPDFEGPFENWDKYVHTAAYALLAFAIGLVLSAWRGYQSRFPIWIWTLAVTYGGIDEYTQQFVDGRSPDVADLACDALGAALGLAALYISVLTYRRLSLKVKDIETQGH